jgi:hypothetical protein
VIPNKRPNYTLTCYAISSASTPVSPLPCPVLENPGELLPSRLRREIETDPAAEHGRAGRPVRSPRRMTQRFASQRLSRRSSCSHRMKARLCQSSEEWPLKGMKTSSGSQTGTAAVGGMKGPSPCREATGEMRRERTLLARVRLNMKRLGPRRGTGFSFGPQQVTIL